MPVTNNFFVYVNDDWKQVNSDFTGEINYLQELILLINNKIDSLSNSIESINDYTVIKEKLIKTLKDKLQYYLYNYTFPNDAYKLAQLVSMVIDNKDSVYSYYIDNVNGSDENTGASIFEPRKTLPKIADENRKKNSGYQIRLMDSPIPYNIEDLKFDDIGDYAGGITFYGNYQDISKVQITSKTTDYTELVYNGGGIGFKNCTFTGNTYIQTNYIGFNAINITGNVNLDYIDGESSRNEKTLTISKPGISLSNYILTDEYQDLVSKINFEEGDFNILTTGGEYFSYAPQGLYGGYNDMAPLPTNQNISNLEELMVFVNYLQNVLDSNNPNLTTLINNIPIATPSVEDPSSRNLRVILDKYVSSETIYSYYNAPIKMYNYDTNELLAETTLFKYSNIALSSPTNVKINIGNFFEFIYPFTMTTTVSKADLRTSLNTNKIEGGDLPSTLMTNNATLNDGGKWNYTLPGSNYELTIKGMRFYASATDSAEYRIGYDNTNSNPQHYIQILCNNGKIIFNEINGEAVNELVSYDLSSYTVSKNVDLVFTHNTNGEISIKFGANDKYTTTLNSALINPIWYINIPSKNSYIRCIAYNGIEIVEYPIPT